MMETQGNGYSSDRTQHLELSNEYQHGRVYKVFKDFCIRALDESSLSIERGYFHPKSKDAKIFENHLNSVMLVFIRKLSLSTLR